MEDNYDYDEWISSLFNDDPETALPSNLNCSGFNGSNTTIIPLDEEGLSAENIADELWFANDNAADMNDHQYDSEAEFQQYLMSMDPLSTPDQHHHAAPIVVNDQSHQQSILRGKEVIMIDDDDFYYPNSQSSINHDHVGMEPELAAHEVLKRNLDAACKAYVAAASSSSSSSMEEEKRLGRKLANRKAAKKARDKKAQTEAEMEQELSKLKEEQAYLLNLRKKQTQAFIDNPKLKAQLQAFPRIQIPKWRPCRF